MHNGNKSYSDSDSHMELLDLFIKGKVHINKHRNVNMPDFFEQKIWTNHEEICS